MTALAAVTVPVKLFFGAPGSTAGVSRPVLVGKYPYTERTALKRAALLSYMRATAAKNLTVLGAMLPDIGSSYGVYPVGNARDSLLMPGSDINAGYPLAASSANGTFVQRIKVAAAASTTVVDTSIPFATDAPQTVGGRIWIVKVNPVPGAENIAAKTAGQIADGLPTDQTLATITVAVTTTNKTSPAGATVAVGRLTFSGTITSATAGATVDVYCAIVLEVLAANTNLFENTQIKVPDAMWCLCGGTAETGLTDVFLNHLMG